MNDEDKQAATETPNEQPVAAPEGIGEQEKETDDLNAALEEFDAATGQPEQKIVVQPNEKAVSDLEAKVNALTAERQKERNDAEIARTVAALKQSAPGWSEKVIKGWLFAMAADDPRVDKAFNGRDNTPASWKRVQAGLAAQIAKEAKAMPDQSATADHDAVASHVRRNGNKTSESPPPKFGELTNNDFQKEVKNKYGYIPRV